MIERDFILIRPSGRQIAEQIAALYDVSLADLTGARRTQRIAHPRQHAMWEIRRRTNLSFTQIGRILNRTPWTVMHGVEAHEARVRVQRQELAA